MTLSITLNNWIRKKEYFLVLILTCAIYFVVIWYVWRSPYIWLLPAITVLNALHTGLVTRKYKCIPIGYGLSDALIPCGVFISFNTAIVYPSAILAAILVFAALAGATVAFYYKTKSDKIKRYKAFIILDIKVAFSVATLVPLMYILN